MTGKDLAAQDVLAAAWRGLSPTAEDGERVRRLMSAALAAQTGASAEPPPGTPIRPRRWLGRLLALGAVAAVAGGVGYRAGQLAERNAARSADEFKRAPEVPATPVPAAPMLAAPAPVAEPAAPQATARPQREASHRPPAPAHAPSPVAPNPDALAEEVRVLRSAERALRESHPGFALALLRELDRSVPNGRLTEERQAVRAIARCASGDVPFGVNLAQDFAEHYPGSVYDRRVTEACAATDSSSSGDLSGRRNR